jgi:hypothetical protein
MTHYYAIAERGQGKTWWISFPHGPGIYSAADDAGENRCPGAGRPGFGGDVSGGDLPRSMDAGARPPADLLEFEPPVMVVVIPFEAVAEAKEAA